MARVRWPQPSSSPCSARSTPSRVTIDAQIRASRLDVESSAELVKVARSNVDLAAQALSDTRDRFAAGVDDNLPVVEAAGRARRRANPPRCHRVPVQPGQAHPRPQHRRRRVPVQAIPRPVMDCADLLPGLGLRYGCARSAFADQASLALYGGPVCHDCEYLCSCCCCQ